MARDAYAKIKDQFGHEVPDVLFEGAGCRACTGTGFKGRQGVFEMMAITDELRTLILQRAPAHEMRKVANKDGMRSLRDDGWRLVREGKTTINEVMQNTKDESSTFAFGSAGEETHA